MRGRLTRPLCSTRVHPSQCSTRQKALLDEHRDELARALEESGFAQANVRTGAWDGDRVGRTGALLGGFRPLDVQG